MGLCKCPKRHVTNQFCFEHRVNVCENCMVTNHPKCIVQSYLQWLQDSDYNSTCFLCKDLLGREECVRLVCYHVFHWRCLNQYASEMPEVTTAAGFICPLEGCNQTIIPPMNLVSPVADALKMVLKSAHWAQQSLGGSLINPSFVEQTSPAISSVRREQGDGRECIAPTFCAQSSVGKSDISINLGNSDLNYELDKGLAVGFGGASSEPRRIYSKVGDRINKGLINGVDHDENKYQRRSPTDWLARWMRTFMGPTPRSILNRPRRLLMLFVILTLSIISLFVLFSRFSSHSGYDPNLDPFNNPNIHVDSV